MVDHEDAQTVLERAWLDIPNEGLCPPPRLKELIDNVMDAPRAKGFKYVLPTALLAKCVDPHVHPRALQAGSSLPGAYDARSLCHLVVVPFEKTKGNLFGLSNEPFLNKSIRHTEHDKSNPQLKNKKAAADLHDALEQIREGDSETAYASLVYLLRRSKAKSEVIRSAIVAGERTLPLVLKFVSQFLGRADGGARLVAIWGALLSLNNDEAEVRVYNPNQSDEFSGTLGDVEVYLDGNIISASECKHRALTLEDVEHGLRKNNCGVEYIFVVAAGFQMGQERQIRDRVDANRTCDVSLIDAERDFLPVLKFIGPHRRRNLGQCVAELLREMREFDSAETAVKIWNDLEKLEESWR